uniref:Uncharacterized protein n=1 Tax=Globisporangium ultimum (strain ATCC 200006 / CBS 805.95 / DAOM BR144) TaxID=431595 RepID=K3WT11_GLOUD
MTNAAATTTSLPLLHARSSLNGTWRETPATPSSNVDYVRLPDAYVIPVEPSTSAGAQAIARKQSGRFEGNLKIPDHFNAEDYYGMFISVFILPVGVLFMYPALWVLTITNFTLARLYLAPFKKPLRVIQRTRVFHVYSAIQFVLALPALLLVTVYWLYLFVLIFPTSLLFSFLSGRYKNFQANWTLLKETRQPTGFTWNDILVGLMGSMHRHGVFEFIFFFPSVVVAVPVAKYLFTVNPFIHKLSCKYANQWTEELGLTDEQAVHSAVQSISWAAHVRPDRKVIDDHEFVAHYPLVPDCDLDGESPPRSVIGVQFTTKIVNFTKTTHNISGTGLRSHSGSRGIYVVELFFWNPCHLVTGTVEMNVQYEGSIEHAMWCFVGENYWGNRYYKTIDNLFWRYAPEAGEYFQAHGDVGTSR